MAKFGVFTIGLKLSLTFFNSFGVNICSMKSAKECKQMRTNKRVLHYKDFVLSSLPNDKILGLSKFKATICR